MITKRPPNRRFVRVRRRKNPKRILYLIIGITAIILLAVSVAIAFLMDSTSGDTSESSTASETSESITSVTGVATTAATTVTTTATAAETTVQAVSVPAPVGDDYFADACFIGDSRTQGLMMYSAPSTATFLAIKGMTVGSYFTDKQFENKTMTAETYLKNKKLGKIYVMLGLNELGWEYSSSFIKRYEELVDSVKASQPNAKIFVQSILPVSAAKSSSHPSFNNPKILEYNKLIYTMCVQKSIIYLNVKESVQDQDGNLPADATTDGIHMNKAYCDKWIYYIRTNTDVPVAAATTIAAS